MPADRGPLWNARRTYSQRVTMLERRKLKYSERIAADQWTIEALAKEIKRLEQEKADSK